MKYTTTLIKAAIALVSLLPSGLQAQTISTIAGNGISGCSGDGGPAINAQLSSPYGVAVDNSGNVYIADINNHRVRKVNPSGVITTLAGTSIPGDSGDGGPATAAQLNYPHGVAVDASSNVYVLQGGKIRKISAATGVITTIVGGGSVRPGDGGSATAVWLDHSTDIAVDGAGNLYIAERAAGKVRKVNTAGIISTVAGGATSDYVGDGGPATAAGLNECYGVDVDAAGNVYIADQMNHVIRKVNTSGIITTVAGDGSGAGTGTGSYGGDGGPATNAKMNFANDVAVDNSGNIYIIDAGNQRIRKVSSDGKITTFAGTGVEGYYGDGGAATASKIRHPYSIATDNSGNLYIADAGNDVIRKVTMPSISDVGNVIGQSSDFIVYPNPVISILSVSTHNKASGVYIVNCIGQVVKEFTTNVDGVATVDVSVLPSGHYYVFANGTHVRFTKQ